MPRAPVVVPHIEVLADTHELPLTCHGTVHAQEAYMLLLASQLCDEILVPAPHTEALKELKEVFSSLPQTQRRRIRLVDTHGSLLKSVERYLEPLVEDLAPVNGRVERYVRLGTALYHLALGCRHQAAVFSRDLHHLQSVLLALPPEWFGTEGRHRLAEIMGLAASYAPAETPRLSFQTTSPLPIGSILEDVLASAEFGRTMDVSGRLGLLREPAVGLRMLRTRIRNLLRREDAKRVARGVEGAASFAMDVAAGAPLPPLVRGLASPSGFAPPFLSSLGSFQMVAAAALRPLTVADVDDLQFGSWNPFLTRPLYENAMQPPAQPGWESLPGGPAHDLWLQQALAKAARREAAKFT